MADDDKRRDRPKAKPTRPPDPRGGPAAILSALAVAGLIFAAAVMLHYDKLPAFLAPSTSLGEEVTIQGEVGSAGQKVTLVASVPAEPKISRPRAKAGDPAQHLVTVAVRIENESEVPVEVGGPEQALRTDLAHTYDNRTDPVTVPAGKAKTVRLQFLVPENEDPSAVTLKVAGQKRKFDVS